MKSKIKILAICNLVFLVYALHYILPFKGFILSLLIVLAAFYLPGYVWAKSIFGKKIKTAETVFFSIFLSAVIAVIGTLLQVILKIPASSCFQLIYLFSLTNLGIVLLKPGAVTINKSILLIFFGLVSVYFYFYIISEKFIPSMIDHDFEIYDCSYGLINRFQPTTTSDHLFEDKSFEEISPYYFAHPPLLSFYGGYSLLMSERIADYQVYDDIVLNLNRYRNKGSPEKLKKAHKIAARIASNAYVHDTNLLVIRTPSLFFSTLLCLVLFYAIFLFSGSKLLGALGTVLYFSFYEVFARSLFGGYMPVENLFTVYFIYQYIQDRRGISVLFSGIYMALIDHKLFIAPLSAFICGLFSADAVTPFFKKISSAFSRSKDIIAGFFIGTAIFWLWGIMLDQKAFTNQHCWDHLFARIFHGLLDLFRIEKAKVGIFDLWIDFYRGIGPLFPVVFIWAAFDFIKNRFQGQKGKLFLFIQFCVGFISFSLVDNRQTKHLMLIMPAMVIFTVMFVSELKKPVRNIAYCLILGVIIWNLRAVVCLLNDFSQFEPLNGW